MIPPLYYVLAVALLPLGWAACWVLSRTGNRAYWDAQGRRD